MNKQQCPTVQHRNYTQYPMTNHNGKENGKQYIHVKLNHYAVQQKLTILVNQLYFNKILFLMVWTVYREIINSCQ